MGVFEFDQFGAGTKTISLAIANASGFSLAGGGDTIAAIQKYDIYDKISYISTAGGAFLEFLEGKTLPAVAMLEQRAEEVLAIRLCPWPWILRKHGLPGATGREVSVALPRDNSS